MSKFEVPSTAWLGKLAEVAVSEEYKSVEQNGHDIPVGAVAEYGSAIVGQGFAMDKQSGGDHDHLHAEMVAIERAQERYGVSPTTLVSTVEACESCQERLRKLSSLQLFAFILPRGVLSDLNLVHERTPMEVKARRGEFHFKVARINNQRLFNQALAPISHTTVRRLDGRTPLVSIDKDAVLEARETLKVRDR